MLNTEIRLTIFFVAKDGEALYSQQKQDRELTVAQIMNSLLPNSDLEKVGKSTRLLRYDLIQIHYDCTVEAEPQGKPKNTGVGSLSLLQQFFPAQESNQGLLHCRWILYQLSAIREALNKITHVLIKSLRQCLA